VGMKNAEVSPSTYFILREQGRVFQDVGLYRGDSVDITGVSEPEHVFALDVTDGVLPLLGVAPKLGRVFSRTDDSPGSPETTVLSYGFWQRKFGGDPGAIGKTLTVDGMPREIIGVLPQNFLFLDYPDPGLILPLRFDRAKTHLGNYSYNALGRLKDGQTLADASADMARLLPVVLESFPPPSGFSLKQFEAAVFRPSMQPLKQDVVGDIGKVLWVLMGGIGLVLLIACANVANLMLVRAEGRQLELAIRAALGASRRQIAGELMLESLIFGLLGGALGIGFAEGALRLLVAMAPANLPRLNEIGLDAPVLLFALGVSIVAGLLFGSVPIWKYAGSHGGTGLRGSSRTHSETRERHRARNCLVVVQVGLALVLLISSGLIIRTFRALTHVNPGFTAPDQVQTFRVAITEADVSAPEQVIRTEQEILRKLAAVPGVSSAAISTSVPMDDNHWMDPIFAKDHVYSEGTIPPLRRFKFSSPGYFKTVGIPLVAGRDFTWEDNYNKLPVAIVSENLAREYWRDPAQALGKQIRVASTDDWREIVGVAGDIRDDGVNVDAPSCAYWPLLAAKFEGQPVQVSRWITFVLRSPRTGAASFTDEVRRAVWSVDSNLPLADAQPLAYYYRKSLARTSFTMVMLALAGGMALLLGMVGLYGVVAYAVSQRTREIGIRMALGAEQRALVGMFVRQAVKLTLIGVACGLAAALALMRVMSSLLFGVKPADPLTYGVAAVGLIATAALAGYLPSRRVAAVNPVEALRAE
jgi:putative ABC transport system permease protein